MAPRYRINIISRPIAQSQRGRDTCTVSQCSEAVHGCRPLSFLPGHPLNSTLLTLSSRLPVSPQCLPASDVPVLAHTGTVCPRFQGRSQDCTALMTTARYFSVPPRPPDPRASLWGPWGAAAMLCRSFPTHRLEDWAVSSNGLLQPPQAGRGGGCVGKLQFDRATLVVKRDRPS